jgi:hypothetical protein
MQNKGWGSKTCSQKTDRGFSIREIKEMKGRVERVISSENAWILP